MQEFVIINKDGWKINVGVNIYSSVTDKWYNNLWKIFSVLKAIDQKYYCSNYYDASINKYGVKCGTSLEFWENKGLIDPIEPMVGFSGIDGKEL